MMYEITAEIFLIDFLALLEFELADPHWTTISENDPILYIWTPLLSLS